MRLGRHMPLAGKPVQALVTAHELGCDAVQIFVTNPRGWQLPGRSMAQSSAFRQAAESLGIEPVVAHAAYLINLASSRPTVFAESVKLLRATMERAEEYGGSSVVFHIGSHAGLGEEAGLAQLIQGLEQVLEDAPEQVTLLLENDVGGGGKLGYRLQNLAWVLNSLPSYRQRVGVCLDTAHLWGAGFDIGTPSGARQTIAEVEETISLARVEVIHLNDTPKALGSHLDNHARIGEGVIPLEGLEAFLTHPGLAHATILLETPIVERDDGEHDWAAEREQITAARALCRLGAAAAHGSYGESQDARQE